MPLRQLLRGGEGPHGVNAHSERVGELGFEGAIWRHTASTFADMPRITAQSRSRFNRIGKDRLIGVQLAARKRFNLELTQRWHKFPPVSDRRRLDTKSAGQGGLTSEKRDCLVGAH